MIEVLTEPSRLIVPLAVALIALIGGWTDLRRRVLPNALCVAAAIGGLTLGYLFAWSPAPWWQFLLHGFAALLVGMGLFALRWIGGGDAKYYAALACWLPVGHWATLLMAVALSGLVVLVIWFTARRLAGKRMVADPARPEGKLPYGVAIGLGAVIAVVLQ